MWGTAIWKMRRATRSDDQISFEWKETLSLHVLDMLEGEPSWPIKDTFISLRSESALYAFRKKVEEGAVYISLAPDRP